MAAYMSVAECADELGVSSASIVNWIAKGHIIAFAAPGIKPGDGQRGRKDYRIETSHWKEFLLANRVTGQPDQEIIPVAPITRRQAHATFTGTDGVSRRRRRV